MKECAALLREAWPSIQFGKVYRSAALYETDQDDFLNTVASFETDATAEEVHEVLLSIEKTLQKAVPYAMGPRTIDIDILLYDNHVINKNNLQVPHLRMHERRFVLEPLCTVLESSKMHPTLQKSWGELLQKTQDQACEITNIVL